MTDQVNILMAFCDFYSSFWGKDTCRWDL